MLSRNGRQIIPDQGFVVVCRGEDIAYSNGRRTHVCNRAADNCVVALCQEDAHGWLVKQCGCQEPPDSRSLLPLTNEFMVVFVNRGPPQFSGSARFRIETNPLRIEELKESSFLEVQAGETVLR